MKHFKLPIIILSTCLILSTAGCGAITKNEVADNQKNKNTSIPSSTAQTNTAKPSVDPTIVSSNASPTIENIKSTENNDNSEFPDFGTNEGNTYENNFFGLTIPIPEDWKILSKEERESYLKIGKKAIAETEGNEKIKVKTAYLLMASKFGVKSKNPYNPNFMSIANPIEGPIKADEYLNSVVKKQFQSISNIKYKLDKEIYAENIGGKEFHVLEAVYELGKMKMTHKYYTTIMKDYALIFITTSIDEEGAKELSNIIKSIEFK